MYVLCGDPSCTHRLDYRGRAGDDIPTGPNPILGGSVVFVRLDVSTADADTVQDVGIFVNANSAKK